MWKTGKHTGLLILKHSGAICSFNGYYYDLHVVWRKDPYMCRHFAALRYGSVRSDPTLVPLQWRKPPLRSWVYKRLSSFLTNNQANNSIPLPSCQKTTTCSQWLCPWWLRTLLNLISSALWQDNTSHHNYIIRLLKALNYPCGSRNLNENASIQEARRVAWPVALRKSRYVGRISSRPPLEYVFN